MINAFESKRIADEVGNKRAADEFREVEKKIEEAAIEGKYRVVISEKILSSTRNVLELLGYKVEFSGRQGDMYTLIKWEE